MDDPLVVLDKLKTYCGQAGFSHMFHNTIGFYNVSRYHADGTSYMSPARDVFDFIENKHERVVSQFESLRGKFIEAMRTVVGESDFEELFEPGELDKMLPMHIWAKVKDYFQSQYFDTTSSALGDLVDLKLEQFNDDMPMYTRRFSEILKTLRKVDPDAMPTYDAISTLVHGVQGWNINGTRYYLVCREICTANDKARADTAQVRRAGQPPLPRSTNTMTMLKAKNMLIKRWREIKREEKAIVGNSSTVQEAANLLASMNFIVTPPPHSPGEMAMAAFNGQGRPGGGVAPRAHPRAVARGYGGAGVPGGAGHHGAVPGGAGHHGAGAGGAGHHGAGAGGAGGAGASSSGCWTCGSPYHRAQQCPAKGNDGHNGRGGDPSLAVMKEMLQQQQQQLQLLTQLVANNSRGNANGASGFMTTAPAAAPPMPAAAATQQAMAASATMQPSELPAAPAQPGAYYGIQFDLPPETRVLRIPEEDDYKEEESPSGKQEPWF